MSRPTRGKCTNVVSLFLRSPTCLKRFRWRMRMSGRVHRLIFTMPCCSCLQWGHFQASSGASWLEKQRGRKAETKLAFKYLTVSQKSLFCVICLQISFPLLFYYILITHTLVQRKPGNSFFLCSWSTRLDFDQDVHLESVAMVTTCAHFSRFPMFTILNTVKWWAVAFSKVMHSNFTKKRWRLFIALLMSHASQIKHSCTFRWHTTTTTILLKKYSVRRKSPQTYGESQKKNTSSACLLYLCKCLHLLSGLQWKKKIIMILCFYLVFIRFRKESTPAICKKEFVYTVKYW